MSKKDLDDLVSNFDSATAAEGIYAYIVDIREKKKASETLADSSVYAAYQLVEKLLSSPLTTVDDSLELAGVRKPLAEYLAKRWDAARDEVFSRSNELSRYQDIADISAKGGNCVMADLFHALAVQKASLFPLYVFAQHTKMAVTSFDDLATLVGAVKEYGPEFMEEAASEDGSDKTVQLVDSYIAWATKEYNRQRKVFNGIANKYPHPTHPEAEKELTELYSSLFSSGEFSNG